MNKFFPALAATCAIASIAVAANAMTAQYSPGATSLSVTEDGYQFEIRSPLVNPGNSLRIYARPRNSNCTSTSYDDNHNTLTMHDDPSCNSQKSGWISLNVPSLDTILRDSDKTITVGARIGGTLKTYDVGFAATVDSTGTNVVIGGLHSEHH